MINNLVQSEKYVGEHCHSFSQLKTVTRPIDYSNESK